MVSDFDPVHQALATLLKVAKSNRGIRRGVGIDGENTASKHLKTLDQAFGCSVRKPHSNPAVMGPEGIELANITQEFVSALEDFRQRCQNRLPEIDIGAGDSITNWIISPALKVFSDERCVFCLMAGGMEGLITQLSGGLIDFAILPESSPVKRGWRSESIGTYKYCLAFSNQLTKKGDSAENAISSLPFALAQEHWGLNFCEKALDHGLQLNARFSCQSLIQVEALVRSGAAAGFLPISVVSSFPREPYNLSRPSFLKQTDRQINLVWKERGAYSKECVRALAPRLLKQLQIVLEQQQDLLLREF